MKRYRMFFSEHRIHKVNVGVGEVKNIMLRSKGCGCKNNFSVKSLEYIYYKTKKKDNILNYGAFINYLCIFGAFSWSMLTTVKVSGVYSIKVIVNCKTYDFQCRTYETVSPTLKIIYPTLVDLWNYIHYTFHIISPT